MVRVCEVLRGNVQEPNDLYGEERTDPQPGSHGRANRAKALGRRTGLVRLL